ncbi:sterol desaturase family protein [Hugenholtzia roseola]|uniref:sterol desaturase family protein n=1 Tax=Hugenholtzia roseola TaxID=1002 RepID=UPI0004788200|nr:sterol desaturase family protein [Hugenholtzia roseola]
MEQLINEKTAAQQSKQIFNNPLLEKLTRTHIAVPLVIFYVTAAVLMYYGSLYSSLTWKELVPVFIASFFLFTLVEYLVHRHVFHMLPTTKMKAWIAYNFHGVHHDYPKDKTRLVMPPVVSVLLATILFSVAYLSIGDWAFGFIPGFISGYASYLAVHYIVHAMRPPKNFLKVLWVHHGIHHYKDSEAAFGVSSPLWDWIFRTMPKKTYK